MNKDTRIVYDTDFYKLSAVMLSDKYKEKETEILKHFEQIGCSIPPERFSKPSEYYAWAEKYYKIIGDNPDAKLPESFLEDILEHFGLDPKNEKYLLRLKWRFFYNKEKGPVIPVNSPRTKWENRTLWVQIPEWTNQGYYESWWKSILFQLDKYPARKKKDKLKTSFPRDFLIYQLYKKKMVEKKNGLWKGSILIDFFDFPEFKEICRKQNSRINSPRELKKIVSYFNRLLSHVSMDTDKQTV